MVYSLNISGSTIRYPPFFDVVAKEFKRFGINPGQVCFEITEMVADRDYRQAIKFMHLLKDRLGCQLSLDDIGIGSSNLTNLSKFNVDFMKIDRETIICESVATIAGGIFCELPNVIRKREVSGSTKL